MKDRELDGRVALVTGASRNIGRAIALALADGGATVVVNAVRALDQARAVVKEIEARGGNAVASLADVTDEKAVGAMVASTIENFGRLDILVNNAAVRDVSRIDDIDFATWRRITMEGTAWRFNRYAERAREATGIDHPPPDSLAKSPEGAA